VILSHQTRRKPLSANALPLTSFHSSSSALFCTNGIRQPFWNQPLPHSFDRHRACITSSLFALLHSFVALCSKSVSQLFCNQTDPHSFLKMPGVTPSSRSFLSPLTSACKTGICKSPVFYSFCTLPSYVSCKSFACHSYENCRVYTKDSHSGTPFSSPHPFSSPACPSVSERSTIRYPHIEESTRHGHC